MNLFIYCSGGLGREVIDLARNINRSSQRWGRIAFVDDIRAEKFFYETDIFRFESALEQFRTNEMEIAIASGEPFVRKKISEQVNSVGIPLASMVSGFASISDSADIGRGTIIFPGCFISSRVRISRNVVVSANSNISHDAVVEENCFLAGHVNIAGRSVIQRDSYIGMGAQVRDNTNIGSGAIIGMGSIVVKSIPNGVVAIGNPCRPVNKNIRKRVFDKSD